MLVSRVGQLGMAGLVELDASLFIAASGYETRATFLAHKLHHRARHRVALGFSEYHDAPQRRTNDRIYESLGFDLLQLPGGAETELEEVFEHYCADLDARDATVLIDVSSMTRAWYGSFFRFLRNTERFERLRTVFLYSVGRFRTPPFSYPQNQYVGPVRGFAGFALPHKPSCLIVGLGHDPGRALGIREELDPGLVASFLARPGASRQFETSALRANADFLELVSADLRFDYPLTDFVTTFQRLDGVCRGLAREAGVVLAPLGPKIFSVCCFVVALNQPEISVWRISAGTREGVSDRLPSGQIVVADLVWEPAGVREASELEASMAFVS